MKKELQNIWNDGDRKEILTKGFSFLTIRFGGVLAGFIFMYLITRNYGASVYGLISLCFSIFVFSGIVGRLGVDINLVRYFSDTTTPAEPGLFYRVLLKSFLAASVLSLLIYMGQDYFAVALFNKPQIKPYLFWTILAIPFWSVTLVCAGLLRGLRQNSWFAFLNNPGRFLFAVIALLLLWAWIDSPLNAIKAHFYAMVVLAVIAFFKCTITLGRFTFSSQSNSWRFVQKSLPMMLSSSILVLLGWMDTFVLGIYKSDADIGIYNVALKISLLTTFSLQAVNSILAPKLAKFHAEKQWKQFAGMVQFSTRLNFITTSLLVIGIIVFHRVLLQVFGEEFILGGAVLIILCAGQLVNAFSGSIGEIMLMTGRQIPYQNIMIAALVVNIILNFTLIPAYGIIGAAVATSVSLVFWNIIGAVYLKNKLGIESYFKPFH